MRTHRLPESESNAAAAAVKRPAANLLELAAHLRLLGTPWPAVAYALDVDVEALAAWRELPAWRAAYARAAQPLRSSIAANLRWVANDPSFKPGLAADMHVVANDLCNDERTALWWMTHAPKPGTFNWNALQPRINRERRRANLGPGWERGAKGQDVDFEDRHADEGPDAAAVTIARDGLERVQRVSSKAQWRAVERIKAGQKLSNADDNALYHLRRKLERLRLRVGWSAP